MAQSSRLSGRLKPWRWHFIAGQCVSNTPAWYPFPLELSLHMLSRWSPCDKMYIIHLSIIQWKEVHPHPLMSRANPVMFISNSSSNLSSLSHAGKVLRLSGTWLYRPGPPQQTGARCQQISTGLFFFSEGTLIGFPQAQALRKTGLKANLPVSVSSAGLSRVLHPSAGVDSGIRLTSRQPRPEPQDWLTYQVWTLPTITNEEQWYQCVAFFLNQ